MSGLFLIEIRHSTSSLMSSCVKITGIQGLFPAMGHSSTGRAGNSSVRTLPYSRKNGIKKHPLSAENGRIQDEFLKERMTCLGPTRRQKIAAQG
ncbi:MAG: hypothetical protein OQL11_05670 [Gammaproteobacteria bacterium]|nr:hypothetical protein [Gammaproteobacteria bacterium]